MNREISFSDFTASDITMAVVAIETAIRRHPQSYLDKPITPFVTVRRIMHGSPPSRWRLLTRRRWFTRLHERLTREIQHHVVFAQKIARLHP